MSLKSLRLSNFRSYKEAEFEFSTKTTVIIGANGSGKTNLIEAIYMLSMTKSWRGHSNDLLKNGEDWLRLEAEYNGHIYQLKMTEDKKFLIGDKPFKPQQFLGKIPVVLFEPGDLEIVSGAPMDRRKFMDIALSALDKQYITSLIKYRRILAQRNQILRIKPLPEDQVFAWDLLLAREAAIIAQKRWEFVSFISSNLSKAYRDISGTKDEVNIVYKNYEPDNYIDSLLSSLKKNLSRDSELGSTSSGPHRDDLRFTYHGRTFSLRGSRGESRSLALALKLLQMRYIRSKTKKKPVLLLDDVFSELDESRQRNILEHLSGAQTIITTTIIPETLKKPHIIKLPQQ